jgi:putative PIN family toxin of toxin-antitoxin system
VKVFPDTNVLVSAFATRGLCADLFEMLSLEHEIVIGEVILKELRRVLRVRIKLPVATIEEIEALLRTNTVVKKPRKNLALGIRDADDEWVVASAVAAGADVLVTGDRDLHALQEPPIRIVTPRGRTGLHCATPIPTS